jgi:hypothetical protein
MKKFIVQTMLLLGFVLGYSFSYAQTPAAVCPKKGTADCPLVKDCPKKGTKDCPYTASLTSTSANSAKTDCPLKGTPECPLVNCPLKGTADCPLVKAASKVSYASYKTVVKKKDDADLPPCCRKESNK